MAPGMAHCGGGPGPNTWDRLGPMVEWVESGAPPDTMTVRHLTDGMVDNERILCPHPQQAVYVGGAIRTIRRTGLPPISCASEQ